MGRAVAGAWMLGLWLLTFVVLVETPVLAETGVPRIAWASLLPGSGSDVAVDADGNAIVGGNFQRGHENYPGIFASKIAPDGRLLWTRTIGVSGTTLEAVTTDPAGNIVMTGYTGAADFPVSGPSAAYGGGNTDGFVVKLYPDGEVLWSIYLGGSGHERAYAVAGDADGSVFVAGSAYRSNMNAPIMIGQWAAYDDAFLAKISPDGVLQRITVFAGLKGDYATGVALDGQGNCFITGYQGGYGFPGTAPDCSTRTAFAAKTDSSGHIEWCTLIDATVLSSIAVGSDGRVAVTGYIHRDNPAPYGAPHLNRDVFVAELDADGRLLWTNCQGGREVDAGMDVAIGPDSNVVVVGTTDSRTFTSLVVDGPSDAFVASFSPDGSIVWSMLLGASYYDSGNGIAIDRAGVIYAAGEGSVASAFPTPNTRIPASEGSRAFIARLSARHLLRVRSVPVPGVPIEGDAPGSTDYEAVFEGQRTVTLLAPESAPGPDGSLAFVSWVVRGVEQPEGQREVQVAVDGEVPVVAVYQTHELTVRTSPVAGFVIGGAKPGTSNYHATCYHGEIVLLTAPHRTTVEGVDYQFICWTVDGKEQPASRYVWVQVEGPCEAVAVYRRLYDLLIESLPIQMILIEDTDNLVCVYTNDTEKIVDGTTVRIIAPTLQRERDCRYIFDHWSLDGAAQPEGQDELEVLVNTDRNAVAIYRPLPPVEAIVNCPGSPLPPGPGSFTIDLFLRNSWDLWTVEGGLEFIGPQGVDPGFPIALDPSNTACNGIAVSPGDALRCTDFTEYGDYRVFGFERTEYVPEAPHEFRVASMTFAYPAGVAGIYDIRLTAKVKELGSYPVSIENSARMTITIPGDLNGDCAVDIRDLLEARRRRIAAGGSDCASADMNGDGVVNVLDLILLRERIGARCP